jgi:hypothetical protein
MVLRIGYVIAPSAPGIEQPDPFARGRIEQVAGGGEAFRSAPDRLPGVGDEGVSHAAVVKSSGLATFRHKSAAFIAKIGVCGTCAAIRASSRSRSGSDDDVAMRFADEAHLDHVAVEGDQVVIEAEGVEQSRAWRDSQAAPSLPLPNSSIVPTPPGMVRKPSERSVKACLRWCMLATTCSSVQSVLETSALTSASGITPITSPPASSAACHPHQAQPAAAIDQPDAAPGQRGADVAGEFDVAGIGGRGGAAIDGKAFHFMSSSIRRAVAFALPTTPGMPAPDACRRPPGRDRIVAVVRAEPRALRQQRLQAERAALIGGKVGGEVGRGVVELRPDAIVDIRDQAPAHFVEIRFSSTGPISFQSTGNLPMLATGTSA